MDFKFLLIILSALNKFQTVKYENHCINFIVLYLIKEISK